MRRADVMHFQLLRIEFLPKYEDTIVNIQVGRVPLCTHLVHALC